MSGKILRRTMRDCCKIFGLVILGLILSLFFSRLILPSQVDDVSPLMNCTYEVLDLGDVYFVVPKFENVSIVDVDGWCEEILAKNKNLAMHGIYHSYEEFGIYRDEIYFDEGAEIFQDCFGVAPVRFKPGQLKWTDENNWVKEKMEVDLFWNHIFHKVYHCGDSGLFPNWVIRIF